MAIRYALGMVIDIKPKIAKIKAKVRDLNPVTNCARCNKVQREKKFEIYDSANDEFFCNSICHAL